MSESSNQSKGFQRAAVWCEAVTATLRNGLVRANRNLREIRSAGNFTRYQGSVHDSAQSECAERRSRVVPQDLVLSQHWDEIFYFSEEKKWKNYRENDGD